MFTSQNLPFEQASWLESEFGANEETTDHGWMFSDKMELPQPESTIIPYVFGDSSALSTPDTVFTQNPFDTNFSASPLLDFDVDSFDICPIEWLGFGAVSTGLPGLCQDGDMFKFTTEGSTHSELSFSGRNKNIQMPDQSYEFENSQPCSRARKLARPSTTSRKVKPTNSSKTGCAPDDLRTNHNRIERRYRTSLNDSFTRLRACLPETIIGSDEEGGSKKAGKADVLVAALQYVRELEMGRKVLEAERGNLEGSIGVWEGLWSNAAGLKNST